MNFDNISIGTDIEQISRFNGKTLENDARFLNRIFTPAELEYCFSHGIPAQHLCARYCAKEAIVKALSDFEIKDVFYSDIEIFNTESGKPYAKIQKYPDVRIKLSLSHSKDTAICVAVCNYK